MTKNVLMLFLLQIALLTHASAQTNAADFPVRVHVVFSRSVTGGGYQLVEAMIDGQRVELTGFSAGVLALGDYAARISTKIHRPKNPNNYDVYKGYDFLMSDGKIRTYQVTAMGQSEFPAPPPVFPRAPMDLTPPQIPSAPPPPAPAPMLPPPTP